LPDTPDYQVAGDSGKTTLWVVFVIMTIASAVFAGMAWRVPVVSPTTKSMPLSPH
jgi:hypothetical protein